MRRAALLPALILLLASPSSADPPASPPPSAGGGVRCTVAGPTSTFTAGFDYATMTGTVTVDGAAGTRRLKIKAIPYAATYNLVFDAYASGDRKPASEALTKGKSSVARLVAYGDVNHLFFDGDFHAGVPASMDGFVCK